MNGANFRDALDNVPPDLHPTSWVGKRCACRYDRIPLHAVDRTAARVRDAVSGVRVYSEPQAGRILRSVTDLDATDPLLTYRCPTCKRFSVVTLLDLRIVL